MRASLVVGIALLATLAPALKPFRATRMAAVAAAPANATDGATKPKQAETKTAARANVTELFPARFMWGWGPGLSGYCGETSYQMAGLRLGNYLSVDAIRWNGAGGELLVAVNDEKAAQWAMFTYKTWGWSTKENRAPQADAFTRDFIKPHVDAGDTVVIGVYERLPNDISDADYDHIVPVAGYSEDAVQRNITIAIYDLYTNYPRPVVVADRDDFHQAAMPDQPYDYAIPYFYDYGIAITGNVDEQGELFPVSLTLPSWTEPDYSAEDRKHEPAQDWTVTVNIKGLTAGTNYALLRFNNAALVPRRDFLDAAYASRVDFTATGATYTTTAKLRSDDTVFFRCVARH